jgi:hypothetical protein
MSKQIRSKQIKYDSQISFTGGPHKITGLAVGASANDAVNKSQLDAIEALVNGFEWKDSALSYVAGSSTPPTEVLGDRYLLDGSTPDAAWDGASANDIVEFDGASWVATTPTTGTFIAVDDEPTVLYQFGGASWSTKAFESTTASTGLVKSGVDIQIASSAAGSGLDFSAGVISIGAGDSSITIGATSIQVGTITTSNFADFAGDVETVVFDAANFVDSSTINFDVTAGASASANVIDGSLDELKLQGITTGSTGLNGEVLLSDGAGGFVWGTDSTVGATNGLTKSGGNIKLGGTLVENTTITGGGNDFTLQGTETLTFGATTTSIDGTTSTTITGSGNGITLSSSGVNLSSSSDITLTNSANDGTKYTAAGDYSNLTFGGTTYNDYIPSISLVRSYVDAEIVSAEVAEKRTVNSALVGSGNGATGVADVFGAFAPSANTIPQVFVNGQLAEVTEDLVGDCFFGTSSAAAVAFNALAGTENLYWNGTVAGYDLDTDDTILVHYSV